MQSKTDLENWYAQADPWQYESNPDDIKRKQIILKELAKYKKFKKALDIGCGEGWITKDLSAKTIHGIELSDNASQRIPKPVEVVLSPKGKYDLVIATGVLYAQYDHMQIMEWILQSASNVVLTCNIREWEINCLPADKQVFELEFPYREYTQKLRIYEL